MEPRILFFDIETTIAVFAGFRLGKQHVAYTQILKRPQVMCISWAWNEGKVRHATFDMNKYDLWSKDDDADYELLKMFSIEMGKADLWVGQNSEWFDVPTITSRLIKYQLPPLPKILHDDTYLQTKRSVRHISHKLDDVGDFLGLGTKEEHGTGMDWWVKVSYGDKKALKDMVTYCDGDVELLRNVYKQQLPYVKSKLNRSAWELELCCTQCGSKNYIKNGFHRTTVGKFQRYRCEDCGHPFHGGKNLNKKTKEFGRSV